MEREHRWEELRPEAFFEELERAPVAYWSCGAMEEHGLHMALGNDWIQMYEVCRRAVKVTGGIVFPQVPFAPAYIPGISREEMRSGEHELYAPSLFVSRELCENLYTELMESMADMGFKVCIALGGHYPADLLLRELEEKHDGRLGDMLFYGGGTVELLQEEIDDLQAADPTCGGHGGMWESSLVMACRSDWADLSRPEAVAEAPFASQLQDMTPAGLTCIRNTNVELGERLLDAATSRAVEKARALLIKAAQ